MIGQMQNVDLILQARKDGERSLAKDQFCFHQWNRRASAKACKSDPVTWGACKLIGHLDDDHERIPRSKQYKKVIVPGITQNQNYNQIAREQGAKTLAI